MILRCHPGYMTFRYLPLISFLIRVFLFDFSAELSKATRRAATIILSKEIKLKLGAEICVLLLTFSR